MSCFDYLERVEQTTKLNEKVSILKEGLKSAHGDDLSFLIERCLNYQRIYLIKDLPDVMEGLRHDIDDGWRQRFEALLDKCAATGRTQATKLEVAKWLISQHPLVEKWCKRVLLRDLKIGVSQDLALKAGFKFPAFEVMLATDGKKCKKIEQMTRAGMHASPKLNGYRCFAIIRDGAVELYSRNGNKLENFPTIEAALMRRFGDVYGDGCYDGEIMSDSFNAMQQSAFASKRKTTVGDVYYAIFGYISITEWDSQDFTTPFSVSRLELEMRFRDTQDRGVAGLCLVPSTPVPETWTLEDWSAYERECVADGYEGAMGNPSSMTYYMGRKANSMVKFKTMRSMECTIVRSNPGEVGGKREGTLGSFTVLQENGKECNVGSGFKDYELDELWSRQDELIGRTIEVKYQELTPDGVMLFPVFKRWRTDKE